MPKKRQPKSLFTKPPSTAPPGLSSARPNQERNGAASQSVNELIQKLRTSSPNHEPAVAKASTTTAPVPPFLRELLDLPVAALPQPRPGNSYQGLTRIRRIPGPPPPKSWLTHSKHASNSQLLEGRPSSKRLHEQSVRLPEAPVSSENSLQHILLKKMSTDWKWHAQFDCDYLKELPLRLRESLLSYIAIYNEYEEVNALKTLFPDPAEADEVKRLDLSNALGRWLSMKALSRALLSKYSAVKEGTSPLQRQNSDVDAVPDSWDEPAVEKSTIPGPLRLGPNFRNLQHLSLALDPSCPSATESVYWHQLLALAPHLTTLSSLSLAYWPVPTYTPLAASTRVKIENPLSSSIPRVVYGGSNMYSSLDNDWREAAGILRTLSRSLYCLNWLDLMGCAWLPALTWESSGPDWNGSWRGIKWLGLSVGWTPIIEGGRVSDLALWNQQRNTAEGIAGDIKRQRLEAKGQMIVCETSATSLNY